MRAKLHDGPDMGWGGERLVTGATSGYPQSRTYAQLHQNASGDGPAVPREDTD
jgi:hypothetical protein